MFVECILAQDVFNDYILNLKDMLKKEDLKQIAEKGISEEQIEKQLSEFKTGFPFLKIQGPAAAGSGIVTPDEQHVEKYVKAWEKYKPHVQELVCLS